MDSRPSRFAASLSVTLALLPSWSCGGPEPSVRVLELRCLKFDGHGIWDSQGLSVAHESELSHGLGASFGPFELRAHEYYNDDSFNLMYATLTSEGRATLATLAEETDPARIEELADESIDAYPDDEIEYCELKFEQAGGAELFVRWRGTAAAGVAEHFDVLWTWREAMMTGACDGVEGITDCRL